MPESALFSNLLNMDFTYFPLFYIMLSKYLWVLYWQTNTFEDITLDFEKLGWTFLSISWHLIDHICSLFLQIINN